MSDTVNMPTTAGNANTTKGLDVKSQVMVINISTGGEPNIINIDANLITEAGIVMVPKLVNYLDTSSAPCVQKHFWTLASPPVDGWV
jgi:hypothetical protein